MRQLHIVHTEASCGWGGQELRILSEATVLQAKGHRLSLVCPEQAPIADKARQLGITVYPLAIGKKRLSHLWAVIKWLKQHQQQIDVINTHSSTDSWLFALANQCLSQKLPMVRTRHISASVSRAWPTRWLYTQAVQHVVTTGVRLKQQLITDNQFPADRISSIATGIDDRLFVPGDKQQARAQLNLPEQADLIGIVATIRSWKGHQYLLEAFAQLKRPNARLVIVGEGPFKSQVIDTMHRLSLQDKIIWAGQQTQVTPWLQALDLFVLPSYANEGVPQSIMQAMLCQIPVIATDVGSISEIVINQQTGVLIAAQQPAQLSQAIQDCLNNPQQAQQYAKQAYQHIKQHYNQRVMAEQMEQLFLSVV